MYFLYIYFILNCIFTYYLWSGFKAMKYLSLMLLLFFPANSLFAQKITWIENHKIAEVPASRLPLVHNFGDFVSSWENDRYYVFVYNDSLMFCLM